MVIDWVQHGDVQEVWENHQQLRLDLLQKDPQTLTHHDLLHWAGDAPLRSGRLAREVDPPALSVAFSHRSSLFPPSGWSKTATWAMPPASQTHRCWWSRRPRSPQATRAAGWRPLLLGWRPCLPKGRRDAVCIVQLHISLCCMGVPCKSTKTYDGAMWSMKELSNHVKPPECSEPLKWAPFLQPPRHHGLKQLLHLACVCGLIALLLTKGQFFVGACRLHRLLHKDLWSSDALVPSCFLLVAMPLLLVAIL